MPTRIKTLTAVGYVNQFVPESGFGFASIQNMPGSPKVSFRIDDAYKAFIENGQGTLGDVRDIDVYIPSLRPEHPTALLMEIVEGPTSWEAVRWGIRPGLHWVHNFIEDNTFEQVIGGAFIEEADGIRVACGTIAEAILTLDRLTVILADGRERGYDVIEHVRHGYPRKGVFTVTFGEHDEVECKLTLSVPKFR